VRKFSAVIPDELAGALEQRARAEDRSVAAEIRRALTAHLDSPSLRGSRNPAESRTAQAAVEARHERDTEAGS